MAELTGGERRRFQFFLLERAIDLMAPGVGWVTST
jgi:hypothetical protein